MLALKPAITHGRIKRIFLGGYIASRSGRSLGSTIDLTVVSLAHGAEFDMRGLGIFLILYRGL